MFFLCLGIVQATLKAEGVAGLYRGYFTTVMRLVGVYYFTLTVLEGGVGTVHGILNNRHEVSRGILFFPDGCSGWRDCTGAIKQPS